MGRSQLKSSTHVFPARLRHSALWVVLPGVLILGLITFYFYYVLHFGVNVPWWDEWNFIPILHAMLTGHLTWNELWAQHNEDRILFPNLLELTLASVTHYNVLAELVASAALLTLTFAGFASLYIRHRLGSLWALVPVAALVYSPVQNYNTLSGFALLWFLALFGLAVALVSLDRLDGHWWLLPIAAGGATIASFSTLPGLLIWPAMLPYLVRVGSTWTQRGIWAILGVSAWIFYFMGLDLQPSAIGGSSTTFFVHNPVAAAHYLVVLVGSVIPVPEGEATSIFGVIILALTVTALTWCCTAGRMRRDPALLFPLSLLLYGLLDETVTTVGRASFGVLEATSPRYTTFTLMLLVGIYLILLRWRQQNVSTDGLGSGSFVLGVFAVILVFQAVISFRAGWQEGSAARSSRLLAADLVVNIDRAPTSLLEENVYPYPGRYLPEQVRFLKRYRLSIFATPAAGTFARLGIVPGGQLSQSLPASAAVDSALQASTRESRAWEVLSTLYDSRPDLQSAFPRGSPQRTLQLLEWATTSGVGSDPDHIYLRPYGMQLEQLLQVASP